MFEVDFNMEAIIRATRQVGANTDQLPYTLSSVLNDAVFAARSVIVQSTWPSHVQQRNQPFISASLRVQKATKENLSAHLFDQLKRGHLKEHADGGTVVAGSHRLTIPNNKEIKRTSRGVSAGQRAQAIISSTPKKSLRVTSTAIFVAEGGRLHYKYALTRSVKIRPDVPFHEVFADVVNHTMRTSFYPRLKKAMATRRG